MRATFLYEMLENVGVWVEKLFLNFIKIISFSRAIFEAWKWSFFFWVMKKMWRNIAIIMMMSFYGAFLMGKLLHWKLLL